MFEQAACLQLLLSFGRPRRQSRVRAKEAALRGREQSAVIFLPLGRVGKNTRQTKGE